jgi:hypothetical protein
MKYSGGHFYSNEPYFPYQIPHFRRRKKITKHADVKSTISPRNYFDVMLIHVVILFGDRR